MNDLQIVKLENTDISGWDFSMLRAELQRRLDSYAGRVYTDAAIKEAKNDRSTLNKVKKVIEDARKAYKARCLAPYDALEPQIRELVEMVERQRVFIDDIVKDFETRQKEEKELEVRKYLTVRQSYWEAWQTPCIRSSLIRNGSMLLLQGQNMKRVSWLPLMTLRLT